MLRSLAGALASLESARRDAATRSKKILRALMQARRGVIVLGACNALSAKVAAELGSEAIYVTDAGFTNMWFSMPDQALMGLHDIADHTARIREAVEVPLIVDADIGSGNTINVPTRSRPQLMRAKTLNR